jgi:hypothetical protein
LTRSDIFITFELIKGIYQKDIRISDWANPRLNLKREFDEIKWLNMDLKPDNECVARLMRGITVAF